MASPEPSTGSAFSRLVTALSVAGCALAYFLSAWPFVGFAVLDPNVTPVWPAAGIALAAVLFGGNVQVIGVWCGAMLVNVIAGQPAWVAVLVASGYALEAFCAAYLLRAHLNREQPLAQLRETLVFIGPVALGTTAIGAFLGVVVLVPAGLLATSDVTFSVLTWWLGDALGVMLTTPLILTWRCAPRMPYSRRRLGELALLIALLLLVCCEVFLDWPFPLFPYAWGPLVLVVPMLVWASTRFALRETTMLLAMVAAFGLAQSVLGLGIMAAVGSVERQLTLGIALAVLSLTVLTLSAHTQARRRAEEEVRAGKARLEAVVRLLPDTLTVLDRRGHYSDVVAAPEEHRPYFKQGRHMSHWLEPQMVSARLAVIDEVLATGKPSVDEYAVNVGGKRYWWEIRTMPYRDNEVISLTRDVTHRRAMEHELRLAALVADSATEAMLVTDAEHRVQWTNASFARIFGEAAANAGGRLLTEFLRTDQNPQEREALRRVVEQAGHWQQELAVGCLTGEHVPCWWGVTRIDGADGSVSNYVHVLTDLRKQKEQQELVNHLVTHDSLTGLPNRGRFLDVLEVMLARPDSGERALAVLTLDIDRFSRLNDVLGHVAGDQLLRQVAARLEAAKRSEDFLARKENDVFVMLVPDIEDAQSLVAVAHRALDAFKNPFDGAGERDLLLSASVGVACYPADGAGADALLQASADAAKAVKKAGGGGLGFSEPHLRDEGSAALRLETELRRAMVTKQGFHLHYQPKVSLPGYVVTGVEALARWLHPELGAVSPDQFIPLMEDLGLIEEFGQWVLRAACEQAASWRAQGLPELQLSVNLSVRQLLDKELSLRVAAILKETGFPASMLELEVTESFGMAERDGALQVLNELAALDIQLALDDFGTAYSNLSHVAALPIHTLKMDRSYVRGLPEDVRNVAISRAVLAMGQALHLKIVAEGVESVEELHFLEQHGCGEVQGYLFSRPLPAEELPKFLCQPRSGLLRLIQSSAPATSAHG